MERATTVRAMIGRGGTQAIRLARVGIATIAVGMALPASAAPDSPAAPEGRLAARDLAAPPEDVSSGLLRLPDPPSLLSDHCLLSVTAVPSREGSIVRVRLPHASSAVAARLSVAFAMRSSGSWKATLLAPDGSPAYQQGAAPQPGISVRSGDLAGLLHLSNAIGVERIDVESAAVGEWTLELRGGAELVGTRGVVILGDAPDVALRGRFEQWTSRVGVPQSILFDADGAIESLTVTVHAPTGAAERATPIADGVVVTPTIPGLHTLHAVALVRLPGGSAALRSIETTFDVSDSGLRLRGTASVAALDAARSRIALAVDGGRTGETVLVAGEVWITDGAGTRPICWLATIADVDRGSISLALDRRWLGRAKAQGGTLQLRDIRVQARNASTVIDRLPVVDLGPAPEAAPFDPREESSLLQGRSGGHAVPGTIAAPAAASDAVVGSHALVLVHGYCSDGMPFPASDFTGAVGTFMDPNAARSNDEFAQLIAAYGANFKSYGTAAHSQGGLASLHLYTFYWSGLDWATGPRLIQSVGAPYQGTPLAGNLAILGDIFGVGCGSVIDMTPAGATAWLANIPTWARQKVWYWTTSYKDYPFSYDYCDFISDLFLSNPDDGVIEKSKGQLPGANNMGHTEGWCHVADMVDPPQCTDHVRNAQWNANAAR